LNVTPCTQGKYGFSTLGTIALKSFAKMKLSRGKTSAKRTVLVSMKRDVVTAPTEGELLLIFPPPTVTPAENINCALTFDGMTAKRIKLISILICK
jgi:hypothetical protein